MNTAFVFHADYLKHVAGGWHPESPDRLSSIVKHLEKINLYSNLRSVTPTPASVDRISQIHTTAYISWVKDACQTGISALDPDTGICPESYDVALLAVGGILRAVDAVIAKDVHNAFCAVRPPGHHAEKERARGFCLFNNIAIAAKYIQEVHHLNKVLIIDWDVHHGNGTQRSFYDDPSVFYISIHQWPWFPGTGLADETGIGPGDGYTMNFPLTAGATDDDYIDIFREQLIPAAKKFHPDFILISAGFDAHRDDPLAGMNLTEHGYIEMTKMIKDLSQDTCEQRIVSVLEGGYHLDVLTSCVEHHIRVLNEYQVIR